MLNKQTDPFYMGKTETNYTQGCCRSTSVNVFLYALYTQRWKGGTEGYLTAEEGLVVPVGWGQVTDTVQPMGHHPGQVSCVA